MDAPDAFEFTSHRESDRHRAMDLTERTMETAARVGASRVVLHLGSVPMKNFTDKLETMAHEGRIYSREYTQVKLDFVTAREKASQFYLDRARAALDELLPLCEQYRVRDLRGDAQPLRTGAGGARDAAAEGRLS